MPDFDDEEYESFELEGRGERTPAAAQAEADEEVEDDSDDDDDEPEDAAEDEIDFVLAAYREDGQPYVQSLAKDLANDLDELIVQLRRLPGDAGALGFVSLVEEVFVIVRVRGRMCRCCCPTAPRPTSGPSPGTWPTTSVRRFPRRRTSPSRWAISACWPISA